MEDLVVNGKKRQEWAVKTSQISNEIENKNI